MTFVTTTTRLLSIRLKDFRSFADSGRIELADLNVFIGPNSAGKTNLMTAIELAVGDFTRSPRPLSIDRIPSFASFDSVYRRKPARDGRARELSLTFEWRADASANDEAPLWGRFAFREARASGASFVRRIEYGEGKPGRNPYLVLEATDSSGREYRAIQPAVVAGHTNLSFTGPIPYFENIYLDRLRDAHRLRGFLRTLDAGLGGFERSTVIVRPYRPVPRSVYVLDDPSMSADDRQLIEDLVRLWEDKKATETRRRIIEHLGAVGLAVGIDVKVSSRQHGPKIVEVRVAPKKKSRVVTLADVGYGVSQVLPLLSLDAQLSAGKLLAYQPEAHLHPLAQSRLADVFVASVKRGNRVYVETHSEHLVLRLQALIAGGEIDPERVRVFCVEHDGEKSNVEAMTFDERGIPEARWPKGFLDTGLELARDLAERRHSRLQQRGRGGG
jgi:hypothetical protein